MPRRTVWPTIIAAAACVVGLIAAPSSGTPDFVEHDPIAAVFGEPPGTTARTPPVPREDESVDIWIRIGYSFFYTDVAVYFTTDGTEPAGAFGVGAGTTAVLRFSTGEISFVRNEPAGPNNIDWWRATLPPSTRAYGATIRYRISAWHSGGGPEVFANNTGCSDGTCDDPAGAPRTFEFTNKLAWPGRGSPDPDPGAGYPPVHFWKEEGVVGNNDINVMVDQNGTVYDVYYPSAGCVQGMGTKNEGYVDGLDTFPPGLPPGFRGQMNVNQAMPGLRVEGTTYWLSNRSGTDYVGVMQAYVPESNTIITSQRLVAGGNDILVEQHDFAPKGVAFPTHDDGLTPNCGLYVKRMVLTNNGPAAREVNVYFHADFALNGGDAFDEMFVDAPRGAMVARDITERDVSESGEYNPTTFGDYHKAVSVYLAAAMKRCDAVGGASGTPATDSWRDTSGDHDQGWVGLKLLLPVGEPREVDFLLAGGFDPAPGFTGTYDFQIDGAVDWFLSQNMGAVASATDAYWQSWLADGVTIDLPDDALDALFRRGLLATALHLDRKNGGIIAGMHNGAYPFVWPRDAVWAAVTLDRAGHSAEAAEIFRFLRDIAFRDNEPWGRGFWKQKYSTDGYTIWGTPQVDETAVYPWGVLYHYLVTGDVQFLLDHYVTVYDAARAMSENSTIDSRLRFEAAVNLMFSMNLWEDSFDVFLYSNANVERGLRDAAAIAAILDVLCEPPGSCNYPADIALFTARADQIHQGIVERLQWNGENSDISQLGLVYPFAVFDTKDPRMARVVDRINGVATNNMGQTTPLVNFSGQFGGLINRYWGDTYWNGGPWWLSTLWYGAYYAARQNDNPGKADIDNHLYRLGLLAARMGPIGMGAEQIAPDNSLLYPGQDDFLLQAAWPNAWESMSFLVDALMLFIDYTPDASGATLRIRPTLPSAWPTMTYRGLRVGDERLALECSESPTINANVFTNLTGGGVNYDTTIRVPAGAEIIAVTQDCAAVVYSYDAAIGAVRVTGPLAGGAGVTTAVRVYHGRRGDFDGGGGVDAADAATFVDILLGANTDCVAAPIADMNGDGAVDADDVQPFVEALVS